MIEQRPDSAIKAGADRPRILVVDDEEAIVQLVRDVLTDAGYEVDVCTRSPEAVEAFRRGRHDLIICDVMMPALDGIHLCHELRRETEVPIIFLSAKADALDRVIGLRAGADDYMGKPFSIDELTVRVERVLRRWRPQERERQLRFGRFVIDGASMQAVKSERVLPLTPTEFRLLRTLAAQPGRVFSRDELLQTVWNYPPSGDTRLVDVHVGRLRRKLEEAVVEELRIETARGFGYRAVSEPASS